MSQSDPTVEQSLNSFLSYCKSGVYNGITVTGGGAEPTGAAATTGTAAAHTTSTGTHATAAATTAATTTGVPSGQKSAGAVNVAGMGLVGLILAIGGALIGM